jgi:GNAT superfamily N-acetyltransferase
VKREATITLRPAVPADAPTIAEIWQAGWADGHLGRVPEGLVTARDAHSFRTRANQRVINTTIAVVDGGVAGFAIVVGDEVEQLYVAATHRGRGVGDALLADAERRIRAAGHPTAWLAVVPGNARARRFYGRRGWSDAGPFEYSAAAGEGSIPVPARRYLKAL